MSGRSRKPDEELAGVHIRVLVVDDFPLVREGLAAALNSDPGIEVVGQASNGVEALERAKELRPDVILLDMRMPILDGWGFAAELRRRGHRTPIVVMTAARDAAHWAAEIAASAFVSKPFGYDDLIAAVESVTPAA